MLRFLFALLVITAVALPQRTWVKVLQAERSGTTQPFEVDGDDGGGDGDGDVNVGAWLAARLLPIAPAKAVARPIGPAVEGLWSYAIQECGPPRA